MSTILDDVRAARESLAGAENDAANDTETEDKAGPGAPLADNPESEGQADDATGAARDGGSQPDAGSEKALGGRTRDESGRFIKGKASKVTEVKVAPQPQVTQKAAPPVGGNVPNAGEAAAVPPQPPPATAPQPKAPQSWKPELREKWGGLPPEVQGEIDRRERETAVAMKEAASFRQFASELQQRVAPYQATLQAYGSTPAEAFGAILQREHQLHSGPVHMRARAWARALDQSGVPPEAINAAWQNEPAQPQQSHNPANLDPAQLEQQITQRVLQTFQAQREQMTRQEAAQEIEAFAAQHEFFDELRPMIGALVQTGMDLQQAYERACWASPEHRKIIQQREAAEQAKAVNASTQRARVAASSVRSQPATALDAPDEPETLLDAVRAARRRHAR